MATDTLAKVTFTSETPENRIPSWKVLVWENAI